MQMRSLGQSEVKISPILMGTWQAGKDKWTGIDDDESIRAIRAAIEAGITTIDTAEVYGWGHSERIVGAAIAPLRDRVQLASKVFANHLKYQQVIDACERSLQNLGVDVLDLYQIHWPAGSFNSELVPIEETLRALTHLQTQGKIRAIGVSNFSLPQLQDATSYARIDSLQPPYSLFWRHVERDLMPYCVENNISILAYSSLAQGLLAGKFGRDHQFDEGDHRASNKLFHGQTFELALGAIELLREIADRYDCSLAQLALAWAIAQPQTNAIAGARNAEQAIANANAAAIELSVADLKRMDEISQPVASALDDNPVMWTFAA